MSATSTAGISQKLLAKLKVLRPQLERTGGSLQMRSRDGTYRLRIRVEHASHGRVHKSITIGDENAAHAVQELIDTWRGEYDAQKAEEERKREAEDVYHAGVRELKKSVLSQASGPSQRRRLAREFDGATKTPLDLYFYMIGGGQRLSSPGRPGRKRRGGLC